MAVVDEADTAEAAATAGAKLASNDELFVTDSKTDHHLRPRIDCNPGAICFARAHWTYVSR